VPSRVVTETGLRTRTPEDAERLAAFEHRMRVPILASALLPILMGLAGTDSIVADTVNVVAWVVFVYDFVVHVRLIPRYLRSAWGRFDLAIVIVTAPWFLIPGLGGLRFVELARLARLARVLKASGGSLIRLAKQLGRVGVVVAVLIVTCAYVAYSAEHKVNDLFATFGDSVWWAVVTLTTVGYGDIYPITTVGRITATVLMFSGLGVLGILAGALAQFFGFGSDDTKEEAAAAPEPPAEVPAGAPDLRAELAAVRARVAELDAALAAAEDRLR
jgi:voltage-gated potassium channel